MEGMPVKPKVLVCDDDSLNLDVIREILAQESEVATESSGEACLERLSEFQPDVVLLDIMMPGMDGYETARRIADRCTGQVPQIVFVSAHATAERRLQGYEAGGDDYISKPFDHDELLAKVRVHARLHRALVELGQAKAEIEAHNADLEQLVHDRTAELRESKEQIEDLARQLAEGNVGLAQQARLDSLTRLLNKHAWEEIASDAQKQAERNTFACTVVMIDIDQFKAYNDTLGHPAGDECLRKIGQGIVAECGANETVGRLGGEEFAVLASETDLDGGLALAERVRRAIEDLDIPHPASPVAGRVTVSLGVATGVGESWRDVLKRADGALYSAKKGGRNRVAAAKAAEAISA